MNKDEPEPDPEQLLANLKNAVEWFEPGREMDAGVWAWRALARKLQEDEQDMQKYQMGGPY